MVGKAPEHATARGMARLTLVDLDWIASDGIEQDIGVKETRVIPALVHGLVSQAVRNHSAGAGRSAIP
jgi:hypothetical protein